MHPIEGKLFSPFQKKVKEFVFRGRVKDFNFEFENKVVWERLDATVNRIRASSGFPIKSFQALVDEVANVTLSNKSFEMYYRGQTTDYKNNQAKYYKNRTPKTIIYPSICRPERSHRGTPKHSIKKSQVIRRYDELSRMIELVSTDKSYFNEYYYALFQHYNILPTPLIDVTQSLRVAATFALRGQKKGYVYVFGLPYPNQSISYYSDLGIVLIKLQNVVPVKAIRPRYQEGYLVGKYPIRPTKTNGDDLSNRLVAKFHIDNSSGNFWNKYFQPMPEQILYPKNDEVEKELLHAKKEFMKRSAD
jgi:hypothetical protein